MDTGVCSLPEHWLREEWELECGVDASIDELEELMTIRRIAELAFAFTTILWKVLGPYSYRMNIDNAKGRRYIRDYRLDAIIVIRYRLSRWEILFKQIKSTIRSGEPIERSVVPSVTRIHTRHRSRENTSRNSTR